MASGGDQITYTKFLPDQPKTGRSARIALARKGSDGVWRASLLLPDVPRYIPFGSENPKDRSPSITYLDPKGRHYWRGTASRDTEQPVAATMSTFIPLRQVRGARAIAYPADADGVQQVYTYELDTRAITQLTFDDGDKVAPWMWKAPEFGNEFVLAALVDNALRVYRQVPGSERAPQWQKVLESKAPPGYVMLSPEPFVYAGRSYVFMGMDVGGAGYSAEIWLANIDPAAPFLRRISAPTPARVRSDPEVFITKKGPRIYFNRYQLSSDPVPVPCRTRECSEGIWMSNPGLPAKP